MSIPLMRSEVWAWPDRPRRGLPLGKPRASGKTRQTLLLPLARGCLKDDQYRECTRKSWREGESSPELPAARNEAAQSLPQRERRLHAFRDPDTKNSIHSLQQALEAPASCTRASWAADGLLYARLRTRILWIPFLYLTLGSFGTAQECENQERKPGAAARYWQVLLFASFHLAL